MYHPGKVIAIMSPKEKGVLSSDSSVQATMKMWDDNVLTMLVDAVHVILDRERAAAPAATPAPRARSARRRS